MAATITKWDPAVIDRASDNVIKRTSEAVGDAILDTMRGVVPVNSGALKDGLRLVVVSDTERYIEGTAEHTEMVLKGTRPHTIKARRGKALKFYWDRVGAITIWRGDLQSKQQRYLFAKWAEDEGMVPIFAWPNHPGTQPNDFVATTLGVEQPRIEPVYFAEACAQSRRIYGG